VDPKIARDWPPAPVKGGADGQAQTTVIANRGLADPGRPVVGGEVMVFTPSHRLPMEIREQRAGFVGEELLVHAPLVQQAPPADAFAQLHC
jgi:hypothetical protein